MFPKYLKKSNIKGLNANVLFYEEKQTNKNKIQVVLLLLLLNFASVSSNTNIQRIPPLVLEAAILKRTLFLCSSLERLFKLVRSHKI